jgi:hypothetical protein
MSFNPTHADAFQQLQDACVGTAADFRYDGHYKKPMESG